MCRSMAQGRTIFAGEFLNSDDMTKEDLLPYCRIYKGEADVPEKYDGKDEGELWVAERFVCEEIPNLISKKHPGKDLENYVEAYVSKWDPFGWVEVMQMYSSYGLKRQTESPTLNLCRTQSN